MPKRLILCFDGTWNQPAKDEARKALSLPERPEEAVDQFLGTSETNVAKLYRSIPPHAGDGRLQQKWYDRGVGTRWYRRFRGGAFGRGLDRNILQGYAYLVATYEDGDEIFIFGFSRGAYTARSLVGMIRNSGLLLPTVIEGHDLQTLTEAIRAQPEDMVWDRSIERRLDEILRNDHNKLLNEAYELYRARDHGPDTDQAIAFRQHHARDVKIQCLGVWDTVGALGIPLKAFEWLNDRRYGFHDATLSGIVRHAYHAMAIDEHRKEYAVTLWTSPAKAQQTVEQRWFVGAHSDVGGGYPERDLSDLTLEWMLERSKAAGLDVDRTAVQPNGDPLGTLHDSFGEFLGGFWKWFHARHHRPVLQTGLPSETIDGSVGVRVQGSRYRPKNTGLESFLATL